MSCTSTPPIHLLPQQINFKTSLYNHIVFPRQYFSDCTLNDHTFSQTMRASMSMDASPLRLCIWQKDTHAIMPRADTEPHMYTPSDHIVHQKLSLRPRRRRRSFARASKVRLVLDQVHMGTHYVHAGQRSTQQQRQR